MPGKEPSSAEEIQKVRCDLLVVQAASLEVGEVQAIVRRRRRVAARGVGEQVALARALERSARRRGDRHFPPGTYLCTDVLRLELLRARRALSETGMRPPRCAHGQPRGPGGPRTVTWLKRHINSFTP
jgi:hypothetical protein